MKSTKKIYLYVVYITKLNHTIVKHSCLIVLIFLFFILLMRWLPHGTTTSFYHLLSLSPPCYQKFYVAYILYEIAFEMLTCSNVPILTPYNLDSLTPQYLAGENHYKLRTTLWWTIYYINSTLCLTLAYTTWGLIVNKSSFLEVASQALACTFYILYQYQ